jgi:predicted nucleotidyltransferase
MAYNNSEPSTRRAILTTLIYSDIFSFPLTKDELWKFLISQKKIAFNEFERELLSLKKLIAFTSGYYCLTGRENIISKRVANASEVENKMERARSVVRKLAKISSVLFIGVSGGLAAGNVTQQDDIDLVIITKKNKLFVTRLLILATLELLGIRRRRNQQHTADTICVNLLFDETALGWFGNHKDIYTAREIAQLVPLFERENMYQRFLIANKWIENFLPNFSVHNISVSSSRAASVKLVPLGGKRGSSNLLIIDSRTHSGIKDLHGNDKVESGNDKKDNENGNIVFKLISTLIFNPFMEVLTRFLQMSMMKRHLSIETISRHFLAFHPYDYRVKTLRQLKLNMRQFGLLTKF